MLSNKRRLISIDSFNTIYIVYVIMFDILTTMSMVYIIRFCEWCLSWHKEKNYYFSVSQQK